MEKPWYSFLYIKSPITKIVWGIVSALVAIAAILLLLIMEPARMAAQASNWEGRSIEKGADIWANNCYTCHGDHGQGGAGPALNSKHFFTQRLTELGFAGTLPDYIKLTVVVGSVRAWRTVSSRRYADLEQPFRRPIPRRPSPKCH